MKNFFQAGAFLLFCSLPFVADAASAINTIITNIIVTAQLLVVLGFVCALMVFVWGIVRFIIAASQGPDPVNRAKSIIFWGVVGMAVLASLSGIILFAQNFFGVSPNNPSIAIPQF